MRWTWAAGLAFLGVGCHSLQCPPACPYDREALYRDIAPRGRLAIEKRESCDDGRDEMPPLHPRHSAPCPVPAPKPPCPPEVEVRVPREIHVQAPPQKIVINAPAAPQQYQPPAHMPYQPPMAPPMAPAAPTYMQANVTAVAQSRAVPAIGLEWIRIPFPVLRLYAVPTTPEISVPYAPAPMAYAPAVYQQPVYQQPIAMPQAPVMQQPVVPVQPVAPPAAPQMDCRVVCTPVGAQPAVNAVPAAPPNLAVPANPSVEELNRHLQNLDAALQRMGPSSSAGTPSRTR